MFKNTGTLVVEGWMISFKKVTSDTVDTLSALRRATISSMILSAFTTFRSIWCGTFFRKMSKKLTIVASFNLFSIVYSARRQTNHNSVFVYSQTISQNWTH